MKIACSGYSGNGGPEPLIHLPEKSTGKDEGNAEKKPSLHAVPGFCPSISGCPRFFARFFVGPCFPVFRILPLFVLKEGRPSKPGKRRMGGKLTGPVQRDINFRLRYRFLAGRSAAW
jgi:hypothetical protein